MPVMTPTLDQRPQFGEQTLADDFTDPEGWSLGQTSTTSAAFGKDELSLALNQPKAEIYSLRQMTDLTDFYLEITATPSLCKGADEYGLLLRVSASMDYYRYALTCDGQVHLDRYISNARSSTLQPLTPSGDVPRGAPSMSRLGVWALGKEMRFYVNGNLQFTVQDPALKAGTLGVFARSAGDNALTVSFSDLVVNKVK
jgi:hypothetical protein